MEQLKTQFILIGILWLVNFGISWWNSRQVGLVWVQARHIGGPAKFLVWCGAVMAIIGFSWCFFLVESPILNALFPQYVTVDVIQAAFAVWYLIAIIPLLGIGFAFAALSIYQAWERRDAASIGVAAWNTFADVHNAAEAIHGVPAAFKVVGDAFKNKNAAALVVVGLLALSAIVLATLLTFAIINHYAGRRELNRPDFSE